MLCLAALSGCASSTYNLAEAPPKAGLKGYNTLVNGKRLSPTRALDFYMDAGATAAEDEQADAIDAYRRGNLWLLADLGIGALAGAVVGTVLAQQSDPNAPGNNSYSRSQTMVGFAMIGLALGAPVGAIHSWLTKRSSQKRFRQAVDAYNAHIDVTPR